MSSPDYSIEARALTKSFGTATAIKDVSFTISPGEVVGFLGPNGAGKSTTLRILSGLLRADRGEAFVNGVSVAREPDKVKECIGFMPESNPLPDDLRVTEYLRFRGRLKGIPGRELNLRVDEAMEQCDLQRTARRKLIGALSKGYRQRVGVADAILSKPAVTIMDEPTIGLDPHQILQIRQLIERMRGSTTVILSSHILAEVEISCDRVLIMNHGHVVAAGTPSELRNEFFSGQSYRIGFRGSPEILSQTLSSSLDGIVRFSVKPIPGKSSETEIRYASIETESPSDHSEPILNSLMKASDLSIREFQPIDPKLEDIFLIATQRSWETPVASDREAKPAQPEEGSAE